MFSLSAGAAGRFVSAEFALPHGLEFVVSGLRMGAQPGWRAANPEYVAAVNEARRAGPFELVCSVCGASFLGARRRQVRCVSCQAKHRESRPR